MKGIEQIAEMKRLSQQAGAWLIGLSARKLRDNTSAPRNDDATYHAQQLLRWAADRQPRPELSDDDYERLLLVHEHGLHADDPTPAIAIIEDLEHRHGAGVWLALGDVIRKAWRESVEANAIVDSPSVRAKRAAFEQQQREQDAARAELRIVCKCMDCGKIRRGRKWEKRNVPAAFAALDSYCPDCPAET